MVTKKDAIFEFQRATTAEGLFVRDLVEGKEGPYQFIINFGASLQALQEPVPPSLRITQNTDRVKFLGLTNNEIVGQMTQISRIANSETPFDQATRARYQALLAGVFEKLIPEAFSHLPKKFAVFSPRNGGLLVAAYHCQFGHLSEDNFVDYELKRLLKKDGSLLVGGNYLQEVPRLDRETGVLFADDCLASHVSALSTLLELRDRGTQGNKVVVEVSAATQRSVQHLIETAPKIGFPDITVIAAIPVFAMSDTYYLLRNQESGFADGQLTVGDMGKFAKRLDPFFDGSAPWNKLRSDSAKRVSATVLTV